MFIISQVSGAVGNGGNWNWKWKMEMENGNSQNLMQMNARVKPLSNDHILYTTSVQRPPLCKDHKIMSQRLKMTKISCYREHFYVKTTFQQRFHLPIFKSSPKRPCFLIESVLGLFLLQVVWCETRTKYGKPIIKQRIYLGHTHFTHVIYLFTVIMCNLGPGHNNEELGHEDRYA